MVYPKLDKGMNTELIQSLCLASSKSNSSVFSGLVKIFANVVKKKLVTALSEIDETELSSLVSSILISDQCNFWAPELGWVIDQLDADAEANGVPCAAQFLLLAFPLADWRAPSQIIEFCEPVTLFLRGAPISDIRTIEFSQNCIRIVDTNDNVSVITYESGRRHWCLSEASPAAALHRCAQPVAIGREAFDTSIIFGELAADKRSWAIGGPYAGPFAHAAEYTVDVINPAFVLLSDLGVEYLAWVLNSVRYISLVPPGAASGKTFSHSDPSRPGVIYVQSSQSASAVAEGLIHEASHQYFYLLRMFTQLTEGNAEYYSPITRSYRPLDRNLLAYHSVANICSYYEELSGSLQNFSDRVSKREVQNELLLFKGYLAGYEGTISSAPELTSTGRVMVAYLSEVARQSSGSRGANVNARAF